MLRCSLDYRWNTVRVKLTSKVLRVKRVSHTKAGGRVISYQGLAVAGNSLDQVGWAIVRSSSYQDCKSKAAKKAISKVRKIYYDKDNLTFWRDSKLDFGKFSIKLKSRKKGTGITANSVIAFILNLSGIENACVKVINRPDLLLLVRKLIGFLQDSRRSVFQRLPAIVS